MGILAILNNDKVVETGVNVIVSIIAFLVLFFGFPTETPIVIEIPFETAIPANSSFCKSNDVDKSKTSKGIITTTTVYASVNFTNKLTYPSSWTNMTGDDRCPELYPIALGPTDLVKGGWGLDEDDEAARVEFVKLFSDAQVATVNAMSDKKQVGKGTEVWTVEKYSPEPEYQQQFDVCLYAKSTINNTDYEWYYYSGDCTTALYIIGKNSVITQESVNVQCSNPDLGSSSGGTYVDDLGVLDPLASLDKLFKQAVVECTSFENSDPQKVFGIALGYGSLVAGAAMGLKSGLKTAREKVTQLRKGGLKGGVKEVGSMVVKADVPGGDS